MLPEIVAYLDERLRIREIADFPNAVNGLQLANSGPVTRIAAAVDACSYTIHAAVERGCNLLLVHHGLFWAGAKPLAGWRYLMWKEAMDAGLAVYSAHLPLDAHPEIGNGVLLCQALGLGLGEPFAPYKGTALGRRVSCEIARDDLAARLGKAVAGPVKLIAGGPETAREIGIVTGGAGGELTELEGSGIDTFITGEGPHWTFTLAEDHGLNVLYGGHYATETFGVRALAQELGKRFGLPWEFIDHPTGL